MCRTCHTDVTSPTVDRSHCAQWNSGPDRELKLELVLRVKNGPDTLEMGCLYYPRKQTSVSYAADCDGIVGYCGAKLVDKHLSATNCVDDEIIGWLERRERRRATS